MLIDGAGPALLPVPASDASRRRILVDALRPDDAPAAQDRAPEDLARPADLAPLCDDTALVVATSGSTGTPKGVAVTHRNSAAFVDAEARRDGLGRALVVAGRHDDLEPAFMQGADRGGCCLLDRVYNGNDARRLAVN